MDYTKVFTESLKIWWRHKSLWLFGILMTIFGQGYSFRVNYNEQIRFRPGEVPSSLPEPWPTILANPGRFILIVLAITIALWLITNLVGALSRGALIGMVNQAEAQGTTSFRSGWGFGISRLKPMYAISLLMTLPGLIVMVAAVVAVFTLLPRFIQMGPESIQTGGVEGIILGIILALCAGMCLFATLGAILHWLQHLASRACVLQNLPFGSSLARGWHLLWHNLGYTLLNSFILFLIMAAYSFPMMIPALVLWVPIAQAWMHQTWSVTTTYLAVGLAVYLILFAICIGGALTSFNETIWTRLYAAFVIRETGTAPTETEIEQPAQGV